MWETLWFNMSHLNMCLDVATRWKQSKSLNFRTGCIIFKGKIYLRELKYSRSEKKELR